jgi:hypothetical protein
MTTLTSSCQLCYSLSVLVCSYAKFISHHIVKPHASHFAESITRSRGCHRLAGFCADNKTMGETRETPSHSHERSWRQTLQKRNRPLVTRHEDRVGLCLFLENPRRPPHQKHNQGLFPRYGSCYRRQIIDHLFQPKLTSNRRRKNEADPLGFLRPSVLINPIPPPPPAQIRVLTNHSPDSQPVSPSPLSHTSTPSPRHSQLVTSLTLVPLP